MRTNPAMETSAAAAEEVLASPPRKDRLSDRRKKLRTLATASGAASDNNSDGKAEAREDAATFREKRIALAKAVHGKNYHQNEPTTPEESKKTASLNEKRLKAMARVKRSPIQGSSPSSAQEEEEADKSHDMPQSQKESDSLSSEEISRGTTAVSLNKIHRWNQLYSKSSNSTSKKPVVLAKEEPASPSNKPRLRLAASPQPDEMAKSQQQQQQQQQGAEQQMKGDPISVAHRRYKQQQAAVVSARPKQQAAAAVDNHHKVVAEPLSEQQEEGRKTPLDFYRYNSKDYKNRPNKDEQQRSKTPVQEPPKVEQEPPKVEQEQQQEEGRKTPAEFYYQRYHKDRASSGRKTPVEAETTEPTTTEGRKTPMDYYRRFHKERPKKTATATSTTATSAVDTGGRKAPADTGRKVVAEPYQYEGRKNPVDYYNRYNVSGHKDQQPPADGRKTPVDGRKTPAEGRKTPVDLRSRFTAQQEDSEDGRRTPIERYRYHAKQEVKNEQPSKDTAPLQHKQEESRSSSKRQSVDRKHQAEVVPWEEAEQMAATEERCTIETPDKVSVSNMKAKFMSPNTTSASKRSPKSSQKKYSAERKFMSRSAEKPVEKEAEEEEPEETPSRATIETPDKVSVSSMADRFSSPSFASNKSSKTPYNTPNTVTPPAPKRTVKTDTATPQGPAAPGKKSKASRRQRGPSPNTTTPSWLTNRVPSEELGSESTEDELPAPKDRSGPVARPKSPARIQRHKSPSKSQRHSSEPKVYAERYKSPGRSQRHKSPGHADRHKSPHRHRPKSPGHPRRPKSPHVHRSTRTKNVSSVPLDDMMPSLKSPSQVERMSKARQQPVSPGGDRFSNVSKPVDSEELGESNLSQPEEVSTSQPEEENISAASAPTAGISNDKEAEAISPENKVDLVTAREASGHPPLSPKRRTSREAVDEWYAERYAMETTAPRSPSPLRARERPWNKDLQTLSPRSWQTHPDSPSPRERAKQSKLQVADDNADESKPSKTLAVKPGSFEEEKKMAEGSKPPSSNSLTQMAADSIHAIDYEQAMNDFGRKSTSYEEDDNSNGMRNSIPSDLPLEFQKALSNNGKPKRMASAELNQALSTGVNSVQTGNGIMFGDPGTYGAAGGDAPNAPPRVGDRAKAIAEWNGGLNARPPTTGKPKVYPVSPSESLLDAKKTPRGISPRESLLDGKKGTSIGVSPRESLLDGKKGSTIGVSPRESLLDGKTSRTISPKESLLDNASPTVMSDMVFSDVVFGDPKTYGYAGGENEKEPAPRVKDRSHAIEEWKVGLGAPPQKNDGSDISAKESILDNASPTATSEAALSEVVFGDPKTFGYAGGEDEKAPAPRVKDRSHAVEEWKGGLGAPPRKKGSSDSDSVSGSGRGAAAVLRFWATTSKEEVEEAHEDWKDKDPDINEYPDSSPEKSLSFPSTTGKEEPVSSAELAALKSWRKEEKSPVAENKKKASSPPVPTDKKKAPPQSVKELDPFSLDALAALDQAAERKTGSTIFDPFFDDCDQADFGDGSNFFSGSASPFGSGKAASFEPKAVEESLPHDVASKRKRRGPSKMKPLPRIKAPSKTKVPGTPNSKADVSGNSSSFLQAGDWSFDEAIPSYEEAGVIHGSGSAEI